MALFLKQSGILIVLVAILLVLNWVSAFTEPSSSPPAGNISAPLNVGSSGQSKSGGLILNTGGAQYGLIIQNGFVGIGTLSPTQALDVAGYVKGQSGICIGGDCRTSWPSGPNPGSNIYQCPIDLATGGNCLDQGLKSNCAGLSTNSTCNRYADLDGGRCLTQTFTCNLVGKLIAP